MAKGLRKYIRYNIVEVRPLFLFTNSHHIISIYYAHTRIIKCLIKGISGDIAVIYHCKYILNCVIYTVEEHVYYAKLWYFSWAVFLVRLYVLVLHTFIAFHLFPIQLVRELPEGEVIVSWSYILRFLYKFNMND